MGTGDGVAAQARRESLLGYLDLDMAFDEQSYVDLSGSGGEGATFAEMHLFEREAVNLMEVLAGADATSGVPQIALSALDARPAAVRLAATLLDDTLVSACAEITPRSHRDQPEISPRSARSVRPMNRT